MGKFFHWTSEAVKIVKERYVKDGPVKLAKLLGTTLASVTTKAKRLGVRPKRESKPVVWTKEMLKTLREIYPTATKEELVEKIGAPLYVIRHKAIKLGLRTDRKLKYARQVKTLTERNVSCNIRYFDTWTDEMAYILGFLFADGNITKRKCDVVVGLAITDLCVLEYIKEAVKSTRKLRFYPAHTDKHGYHHQESVYLTIGSKIVADRLMALGMMPRKTYRDDPFPDVPDEFLPHFVRGYFDGDGTAFIREKDKLLSVRFIGSFQFIRGILGVLVRKAGMSKRVITIEECPGVDCGRIGWCKDEDLKKFRSFVYPKGFAFCLQRKKTVIDTWLAKYDDVSP